MENDIFKITLSLKDEFLTTVRLATGGLCSLAGFDLDTAEDYKLCVTEALLILKRNGCEKAEAEFSVGEMLSCTVSALTFANETDGAQEDDGISLAILSALAGDIKTEKDGKGRILSLSFKG